jgi:hypothetical protein
VFVGVWVGGWCSSLVVEVGVLYFSRSSDVERERERECVCVCVCVSQGACVSLLMSEYFKTESRSRSVFVRCCAHFVAVGFLQKCV